MSDVVHRFLQKDTDVGIVQLVENMASMPLAHDESQIAQHAKLMRDRRLLHPVRGFKALIRAGNGSFSRRNRSFETPHRSSALFWPGPSSQAL
jgi:hypothetical protein